LAPLANKKKELLLEAMFVGRMEPNEKVYRGSYIDVSCQAWFNLAKEFQREDFFNISQSETRIALGSHICWSNETKRRNFIEDLT
jgi:hypothetical protein